MHKYYMKIRSTSAVLFRLASTSCYVYCNGCQPKEKSMTNSTSSVPKCQHCGSTVLHVGICPTIQAVEYFETGVIKRIEYKTAADYCFPTYTTYPYLPNYPYYPGYPHFQNVPNTIYQPSTIPIPPNSIRATTQS